MWTSQKALSASCLPQLNGDFKRSSGVYAPHQPLGHTKVANVSCTGTDDLKHHAVVEIEPNPVSLGVPKYVASLDSLSNILSTAQDGASPHQIE